MSWSGGGILACLADFQAHTQGEVEGSGQEGVSRSTHKEEVEGSSLWGSLGPHQCGSPGPHPGGSPGPHLGGLQAHTRGCIPACTEADPLMATAAGGTHPTGMHSCFQ